MSGMGGMTLPQLLRAESQAELGSSTKSVIMIYLGGGPSHLDLYDIKENAPSNIRGEFNAMATSVPGIRVCEHLPQIARNMEKFAPVRSIVDSFGQHSSYQCETGHTNKNEPAGGWPSMGAVLGKFSGQSSVGMPSGVSMNTPRSGGGFLGAAHQPFLPNGKGKGDMIQKRGLDAERLDDRKDLLASFDQLRRDADSGGLMEGMDEFNQLAFEVVTSSRLIDALDPNKADASERARYLQGVNARYHRNLDQFLTARRLVEAGARYVTLSTGGWDTHNDNFKRLREANLPVLDRGVATLVEDLHYLGLDRDVSVVVWGEFGRTPKVNGKGGRDHWPRVMSALLAGGGMKTGQVIGSTDRDGGEASSRPVRVGEIFATLYQNCGLNPAKLVSTDLSGRPLSLVDPSLKPMRELV
tara:strand:+ start:2950 stop:4185 length:1236 start_codon:yes stop_codon:yes gene_type:complete